MKHRKIDAEKLGKRLAEYGSLDKAIEEMKSQLISSKTQLEELEEKRKTLQAEVEGLSKRKARLKEETNKLEKLKQSLSQTIVTMQGEERELREYLPGVKDSVTTLEKRKLDLGKRVGELGEKIKENEERLKILTGTSEELEKKARLLRELEAKISASGLRFQLFEGLLGFIRANTGTEMEVFAKTLPLLIDEVKRGKYAADSLRKYVLRKLTWDTLKVMACKECGIEFMIVGRTKAERAESYLTYRTEPEHCPVCGRSCGLEHKMEIAQALMDELKPPVKVIQFVPVTPTLKQTTLVKGKEEKTSKEVEK